MDPINVLVFTLAQRLNAPADGLWVWRLPGGWRLELNTTRFLNSHGGGQSVPPGGCIIYWNSLPVGFVTPNRSDMMLTDEDRLRIALERAVDAARRDRSDYKDPEVETRRGVLVYAHNCAINNLEKTISDRKALPATLTNGRGQPMQIPKAKHPPVKGKTKVKA